MNPERWERLKQLFASALERGPTQRTEFLRKACTGDESLQTEVESMLARHDASPDFLESPALQAEAEALARDLEDGGSPTTNESVSSAAGRRLPFPHSAHPARPPWWMYLLAVAFLADCILRTYCFFLGPRGFDFGVRFEEGRTVINSVPPGSEADRAGIRAGDILLALDSQAIRRSSDSRWVNSNLEPGRVYRIDIQRGGRHLQATYSMGRVNVLENRIFAIWQIDGLLLLATAFLIAFARPCDSRARIGALGLAALSVGLAYYGTLPHGYAAVWRGLPWGVGALLWIPIVSSYLLGPILLTFFILFPRPLFRARWPWAVLWLPALCFVPAYFYTTFLLAYRPLQAYRILLPPDVINVGARLFGLYGLVALGALTVNYFRITESNDRRRLRVLLVGGAAGVLPGIFRLLIWRSALLSAIWGWVSSGVPDLLLALIFVLFPASFAYSILRHRLLDIRIIIRQGMQYAVTRGALLSVVPILGIILLADLLVHGDQPLIGIVESRGWVYAALGVAALAAHSQRRRWGEAIDRRFFREQYDARRLLREVAAEAGRARSFTHAAPGAVARIESALHPEFAAVLQWQKNDTAFRTIASVPSEKAPPAVFAESSLISLLRIFGDPAEVALGESSWVQRQLPVREIEFLRRARIDLIVPIGMALERNQALLALGTKRSEEPYTRDDRDLLASIASSLEVLLERPEVLPARSREEFEECPRCGACYDTGAGRCAREDAMLTAVHMPRTLAGRYRLERRRGQGGMGAVYEATDKALARQVAVKVIREDRLDSPGAAQRFQREARVAAGFTHPNVVTVYDYGIEAGMRAFLVMELLEGTTLRDELESHKRLDAARTVRLFRGLCNAVEAAHVRQLIHRDLKPENIFLARSGDAEREMVKVLDFGIAKFLPGSEEGSEARNLGETDAGMLIGTPGYMSPEQLLGERPAISWDLWALAVTVYETLTGTLPFPAAGRDKWRQSVLAGDHTPLSAHLPDPPAAWEQFFACSLAADRASRPCSATEFLQHLERALACRKSAGHSPLL